MSSCSTQATSLCAPPAVIWPRLGAENLATSGCRELRCGDAADAHCTRQSAALWPILAERLETDTALPPSSWLEPSRWHFPAVNLLGAALVLVSLIDV
jgi:hypothetical protein